MIQIKILDEFPDDKTHVCVVMPTYNERENVERRIKEVYRYAERDTVAKGAVKVSMLIVDDNSPDGTATIVKEYAEQYTDVHLLVREEKEGLGAAYIHGFKYALKNIKPDIIVQMDADGQHDPKDMFRLVRALQDGADMAIGSRYVEGGSVSGEWGIHRKFTNICARMVAKTLLKLPDIKDCSGGYRATRVKMLEKIDLDNLNVKGYAFQAVLLEAIIHNGGLVQEVPIRFGVREEGESKMGVMDMIEGGLVCARVRTKRIMSSEKRKQIMPLRID